MVSFIEPQKGYRKTTREYHPKEIHDEILPLSMDLITKRLFFHVTTGRNQTIAKRVGLIMSSLTRFVDTNQAAWMGPRWGRYILRVVFLPLHA